MSKSSKSDLLEITNKTLRYSGQIFQISNLTNVGKYKLKKKRSFITSILLLPSIAGAIGCVILGIRLLEGGRSDDAAFISFVIAGVLFIIFLLMRKKKNIYALGIETNSGSTELFSSKNEEFIDDLVLTIARVMEDQNQEASYTVNIKSAKIQNNSIGEAIMGDKFGNISNSAFINKSDNSTLISKSNLDNALNQVTYDYGKKSEKALKIIADHISKSNNKEAIDLFNSFNAEISKGNENKAVLRVLWDGFVKVLPDVAQVASAVKIITKMLI